MAKSMPGPSLILIEVHTRRLRRCGRPALPDRFHVRANAPNISRRNALGCRSDEGMTALATLFRASERIGFAPTVLFALVWFVCGTIAARAAAAASFLWQIPALGLTVELLLFIIIGVGGLVTLWLIAHHVRYWRRGYRMRWTSGNEWLYEERVSGITARSLPCVRIVVGKGYPAPSEVHIISEASWDLGVPPWARGRRGEITQRISECFGGDRGANISFVDA